MWPLVFGCNLNSKATPYIKRAHLSAECAESSSTYCTKDRAHLIEFFFFSEWLTDNQFI